MVERPLSPHLGIYRFMYTMATSFAHRSTGVALWVGGDAISQLWLFWLAPIVGALLAGWVQRQLLDGRE